MFVPLRRALPRQSVRLITNAAFNQRTRLDRPISVAPMVDISTPHFIELLRIISGSSRYAYYTEMHHGQAILHHTSHLDWFVGPPQPNVVVQLGGAEPHMMAQAAKALEKHGYREVNINVGCPSANVQSGKFGAVLMKTPEIVADILSAMETCDVSIPVTVKCRIGVDKQESFEFLEKFVDTLLQSKRPPPHLIVHARKCILKGLTPKKNRTIPPLNYDRVYQLRDRFPELPISINGGFTTVDMVNRALEQVDGCMIGRQVMNHPMFLQELDRGVYNTPEEMIKTSGTIINEYIDYGEKLLSEKHLLEGTRLPPLTILIKPLMMLFEGRHGRNFRRELFVELDKKPSLSDFRSVVLQAISSAEVPINFSHSN